MARVAADQERDPQALSRPRLYGRRHLRGGRGGTVLFRQVGARRDARRGGDARRPVQGADQVRPAHQPAGRPRPRKRGARQPGRGRLHDRGSGVRRPPQPGEVDRPARRGRPQLLSRLRLRRDAQAGRQAAEVDHRARLRGAHRARSQSPEGDRQGDRRRDPPVRPGLSRQAGGHRGGRHRRRGAGDGRRRRLRREPVQPGDRRAAPAGLLVQALCLLDRAAGRHDAELAGGRRAGLPRQLVPEELWRQLSRCHAAGHRAQILDQHRGGEAVDLRRQRQREGRPRKDRQARQGDGRRHAAPRHALAADRRRRGARAEPHRRLRHLPERRRGGDAARHPGGAHRHRRDDLAVRP
ncbi:hypothetical protein A33M_3588 [Rhodovulum sp. PH10]|nr:hypothetical protein A33M_3588 [Rhodovulum sp. PH10]